jgi:hypothetical protein
MFRPLVDNLLQHDPFLVLADYADYVACQERVSAAWNDRSRWTCMSILNTARGEVFVRPGHSRVLQAHMECEEHDHIARWRPTIAPARLRRRAGTRGSRFRRSTGMSADFTLAA